MRIISHFSAVLTLVGSLALGAPAHAHFGIILPSQSMAMQPEEAALTLKVAFAHPFAQTGMTMEKPKEFYVCANDQKVDLLPSLRSAKLLGEDAWTASYHIQRPGVYTFAMTPTPYYESAEDRLIIHYVKTVVGAYGAEDGWDIALGLPMEIVPLTRPFGNYAGNSFTGLVLKHGQPLPHAVVEVEFFNGEGTYVAPNEYFVTQRLFTDANGVFTFAVPWAGWWGFAALSDGTSIVLDGKATATELGGVLWSQFVPPSGHKSDAGKPETTGEGPGK